MTRPENPAHFLGDILDAVADAVDQASLNIMSGYTDHDDTVADRALRYLQDALREAATLAKGDGQ